MTIIFVLVCVNFDLNIGQVRLFVDRLLAGIASFSQDVQNKWVILKLRGLASHYKLIIISPLR